MPIHTVYYFPMEGELSVSGGGSGGGGFQMTGEIKLQQIPHFTF